MGHQHLAKLFAILALVGIGTCLKIESVNKNVKIDPPEGSKCNVHMDENNQVWDQKPTPLFKIFDYKTHDLPLPEFTSQTAFKYDISNDVIRATQYFDYESQDHTYYMNFQDTEARDSITIIFNINNIDDEQGTLSYPQCDFNEHTLYNEHNSPCNCTISDPDGWLGKMTFNISSNNKEDEIFNLTFRELPDDDEHEAYVYMTVLKELDYKTANFYSFNIEAEDSGHNPTRPKDVRASVTVKDLRDSKPVWITYFSVQTIDELVGKSFTFTAIDGDTGINASVLYSKVSEQNENANYISIDKHTGILDIKPIDRDTDDLSVYTFQIVAYLNDTDNPGDWSTPQSVTLYINDLDNKSPVIVTRDKIDFEFFENFAGSFEHPILIEDKDTGENAQFSVALEKLPGTKIDYTEAFIITPNAGYKNTTYFDISVRNKTYLDYENSDWREITFNIFAKGKLDDTKQDSLKITVNLRDLNDERPTFAKSEYITELKETAKKEDFVIQVMATDADEEDQKTGLNHTLLGPQRIRDSLEVDPKTGVVTVKIDDAFDYDKVNPVFFQVKAEDNADPPHSATVPVTINIQDVNNKPPSIHTGDPIRVKENQKIRTKLECSITADDPDTTANLVASLDWENSYAMKNSIKLADENLKNATEFLNIEQTPIPHTRGIKIDLNVNDKNEDETSPDFETFDSLYLSITVEDLATDPAFKKTKSKTNALLMISIIDVNDNAPYFPEASATKPENRTVTEKTTIGTPLGYSIQAIDVDLNDTITYACLPDDGRYDWLTVDSQTGAFSVKSDQIDADIPLYYFNYTCMAHDKVNHQSEPLKVAFYIIDTNDKTPAFNLDPGEIHIDEEVDKDKKVKEINPTDGDRDRRYKEVVCSITGDEKCRQQFIVYESNIIQVRNGGTAIDRDTMDDPTFECKVKCEDCPDCQSRRFSEHTCKIILDDINDNPPILKTDNMDASESIKKGQLVQEIIAEDIDKGANAEIEFSITSVEGKDGTDCSHLFSVLRDGTFADKTHKKTSFMAKEDLQGYFGTYTVYFHLCDKGEPRLCGDYKSTLKLEKFNFIEPRFVYPEKDEQNFILLSVQQQNSPLILFRSKDHLQDFSVADNIHTNTCIRWDTDIYFKQIKPAGETFFMLVGKDKCVYQLQVKGNFNPDLDSQYELQLTADIKKKPEERSPGEANYTSNINILVNFLSNAQEPTFVDCKTQVFEVNFYEEDVNQNYTICQAKYQIDDPDLQIFYYLVSDDETIHSIFKVNSATGMITLDQKLDFEKQEKCEFQIVASNDTNPSSENRMSYANIVVNVLDINDHAPEFTHKQYFGALMTGYRQPFTIIELKATDADKIDEGKLTYSIVGEISRKGEGIQDITNPFYINDENSGMILLNFTVEATMSGYFSFDVMVKDVQDDTGHGPFNSTAPVTIFIVTSDNTVKFRFENTVEEVKDREDTMCDVISNILKLEAHRQIIEKDKDSTGKELNITVASLYFINRADNLQTYSLNQEPAGVMDASYILRQVRDVETYMRLQRELRAIANLSLLSFPNTDTISDDSDLLRAWLIGVSVVLGALCVMLLILFIIKTRRLSNKIKKLTSKQFGSQESGLNNLGFAAPNTNKNAIEGSNPVFRDDDTRKNSIMNFADTEFDRASTRSGDSELQDVELNPEFDLAFDKNEDATQT